MVKEPLSTEYIALLYLNIQVEAELETDSPPPYFATLYANFEFSPTTKLSYQQVFL